MDDVGDHPGIPRDADGVPIFLVLPPELRASYDKKMRRCERGWQTTRDPAFVGEAQILTTSIGNRCRAGLLRWYARGRSSVGPKDTSRAPTTRGFG
jgi:hypothetical protein